MHGIRALVLITSFMLFGSTVYSADWSNWRGPGQNGVSLETNLPERWSPDASKPDNNLVWRAPYGGRTTPIVQNDRVYMIGRDGEGVSEQERCLCFDANTGKLIREYRFNVFHTDIVSVRLGWTNMVGDPETGNVYAHGTQGLLFCFDKDLKLVWQHSLTEEFGRVSGYGGRVTSPIIDEDKLIIGFLNASWGDQGIGRNRFVAMDKKTGKVIWWNSTGNLPKDTFYSTPVVTVIDGVRTMVSGGGDGGVHAFQARTGVKLWSYILGPGSINCSPVVQGNLVYIGLGEENDGETTQGRVVCLDGSKVTAGKPALVWKLDGIKAKFASPVLHDGKLYMCGDTGQLYCIDAATGKLLWDYLYGKNTKGSPVLADGKIYLAEVNSKFHILRPTAEGCEKVHTQFFKSKMAGEEVEINGSPAIANGRVYFMTGSDLYCIGAKEPKASAAVAPAAGDGKAEGPAAHLQIFPADITVFAGDSVELAAHAYDAKGRLLGPVSVNWSLAGMKPPEGVAPMAGATPPPALVGKLSAESGETSTVTPAMAPPAQFGRVVIKSGNLTAECRVRVVPRLPYAPNLANIPEGRTPGGWVNCQGKFAIVMHEGKKVLKKLAVNPSPLVSRANAYISRPDSTGYAIRADIQGTKVRDDLPDVGVVANRYTLMLAGNTQQLRLTSWDALPRVDKSVSFPWKAGVWYTMKFEVVVREKDALIRGKVWDRTAKEPEEWTVEFTDPVPNREGSAAIYGYAAGILEKQTGCEIYYDNIRITDAGK